MKEYLKKNIIPAVIEICFIVSCFTVPHEYFIYTNFIFYLCLFIYFCITKAFSIKEWLVQVKSGKRFWKQVVLTAIMFLIAFVVTIILEGLFPTLTTGYINLKRDTWLRLFVFAISTIILPPITEELFFRKSLIAFKSKGIIMFTALIGMFLYAIEHSLSIWGIFLTMIWALPLTVSYIKTKNIYVPMTAHLIGNLLGNGIDVVMTIITWI